jgi:hypothetical protein
MDKSCVLPSGRQTHTIRRALAELSDLLSKVLDTLQFHFKYFETHSFYCDVLYLRTFCGLNQHDRVEEEAGWEPHFM